jgi:hypothetical protein
MDIPTHSPSQLLQESVPIAKKEITEWLQKRRGERESPQERESHEIGEMDEFPGYSILRSTNASPSEVRTIVFTSGSTGIIE